MRRYSIIRADSAEGLNSGALSSALARVTISRFGILKPPSPGYTSLLIRAAAMPKNSRKPTTSVIVVTMTAEIVAIAHGAG